MPGQHVADASDAAVGVANHGEPFECEGRPGAIPQEMLERLKIARHVAVEERDPHTRVDRKPTTAISRFEGLRMLVSAT